MPLLSESYLPNSPESLIQRLALNKNRGEGSASTPIPKKISIDVYALVPVIARRRSRVMVTKTCEPVLVI